jgi:hypothetical protein
MSKLVSKIREKSVASTENKLPPGNGGGLSRTEKRYVKGSHASVSRLKKNSFDPIDELVNKYRRLEAELEYYEDWRSGKHVPLKADGNIRHYNEASAMTHFSIYDRLTKTAEALLRYAYGKVPENLNLSKEKKPLIINLSPDQASYELLVQRDQDGEFDYPDEEDI